MRHAFLSLVACLGLLCFSSTAEADKRKPRGHAQKLQNLAANRENLSRIKSPAELKRFVKTGLLVRVPDDTAAYYLDPDVGWLDPANADLYRYARPWTKKFLDRELADLSLATGYKFKITSLVRTEPYQKKLCRKNGSAICGKRWWERSSHLTGATVDISKDGMSGKVKKKVRKRLKALQSAGKILYIEEHGCFHVMVRKAYAPAKKAKKSRKKRAKTR